MKMKKRRRERIGKRRGGGDAEWVCGGVGGGRGDCWRGRKRTRRRRRRRRRRKRKRR
jgi:hypothetical protein